MPAVRRSSRFAIGAALIAVAAAGCANDDGTQALPSTQPRSETSLPTSLPSPSSQPPIGGDIDAGAYCDVADGLEGERPESYVGSTDHQADISALAAVAPEPIREALATYSEVLTSGAVEPEDPDSNLFESWPAEVRRAR